MKRLLTIALIAGVTACSSTATPPPETEVTTPDPIETCVWQILGRERVWLPGGTEIDNQALLRYMHIYCPELGY